MRRLYSSFANGAPGTGLLLLRVAAGSDLVVHSVKGLVTLNGLQHLIPVHAAILGLLILVGLWTPIAGTIIALEALLLCVTHPPDAWQFFLLGAIGAALALLGPGAWSIDARLFGWRRIEIPD